MAARSLERGAGCMEHFRSIAMASPLSGASLVQPFMKSIPIGSPISALRHGLTAGQGEWLIASQVPLARVKSRNPSHRGAGQGDPAPRVIGAVAEFHAVVAIADGYRQVPLRGISSTTIS